MYLLKKGSICGPKKKTGLLLSQDNDDDDDDIGEEEVTLLPSVMNDIPITVAVHIPSSVSIHLQCSFTYPDYSPIRTHVCESIMIILYIESDSLIWKFS